MSRIPGIDLLRFIGASSVIATHLGASHYFDARDLSQYWVLIRGGTGIHLFFVISGFLITTLALTEIRETSSFSVKSFMRRRIIRIFPLYYFALGCYLMIDFLGVQSSSRESYIFAFTYTYNFIPRAHYDSWLGSFHTLATEEHFYLLYPLLIAGCLKFKKPLWIVLLCLILIHPISMQLSTPFNSNFLAGRWTFNAWLPILIGCLFGVIYDHLRNIRVDCWVCFSAFGLLYATQIMRYDVATMSIAFGLLILGCANLKSHSVLLFLNRPVFYYLGSISYGLYVWQSLILATSPQRALITDPILAVLVVFALSALSWQFIEKPLLKFRHPSKVKAGVAGVDTSGSEEPLQMDQQPLTPHQRT